MKPFGILQKPSGRGIQSFIVALPLNVNASGEYLAHGVFVPTYNVKKKVGRGFSAAFKMVAPRVIVMDRAALSKCEVLELSDDLTVIAERALDLAEKSIPVAKSTVQTFDGRTLTRWRRLEESHQAAHRIRWEILSCYLMFRAINGEFEDGLGQTESFHAKFIYNHPNPPEYEAFKKACREMGIRFKRRSSGKK